MNPTRGRLIFTVTNDLNYDQRMIRICSTLQSAGYQVRLIGRKKSDSTALVNRSFEQHRLFCFFQHGKFFYIEYNLRLFLYLLFQKFDLACAIDLDTILPIYFSCRLKRKKWVYDAHEYFTEVPEVVGRPRIKLMWEKLANWLLPKSKYNYTVGPKLAQIFKQRYGQEFEVIRNVPFKKVIDRPKKAQNQPFTVIYQGALNEGRGIEASLQAFQYLESAQLWIVGEGDLSLSLRQMAESLKLGDKVKFWGYQQPEALKDITAQADLGLNLLENKGLSYYYSLANKFFDYIQAGLPSLNMAFPEYQAIMKNYQTGILLEHLDATKIAAEIQDLMDRPETYQAMSTICRKAAEEYNWENEQEKLLQFYETVLTP